MKSSARRKVHFLLLNRGPHPPLPRPFGVTTHFVSGEAIAGEDNGAYDEGFGPLKSSNPLPKRSFSSGISHCVCGFFLPIDLHQCEGSVSIRKKGCKQIIPIPTREGEKRSKITFHHGVSGTKSRHVTRNVWNAGENVCLAGDTQNHRRKTRKGFPAYGRMMQHITRSR